MKAIEINFSQAVTHSGDKYFFACYPKDYSGLYLPYDPVYRLVEAVKKVVRIIDHDAHIKAVFELEAALAPFMEEK